MLEIIEHLPDNTLGVRAVGEVTAEDYENVLIPELEARLGRHDRLRFLYVLGEEFEGFSAKAVWDDTRVGMRHLTRFDRIAVVSDTNWIRRTMQAVGFVVPGDLRVFSNADLGEAVSWISERPSRGHLEYKLIDDERILILEPRDELEAEDFEQVASVVDPFIEAGGKLAGIVVIAEEFPGWEDFAAMLAHLRFVREHQAEVRRVALVTGSRFLAAVPRLASVLTDAEVRRFEPDQTGAARAWVAESLKHER